MGRIASRLWRAFFDAGAYREVARGSIESCLLHVALAVALVWLAGSFAIASGLEAFTRGAARSVHDMPDVHIEGGTARLDPPGRHEIAVEGEPLIVLDPELSVDDALAFRRGIFLTGRQLVVVNDRRPDARVLELETLGDRVITEADVQRWLAAVARYGPFVLFPFAVAFSFVWRLAAAALLGLVGLAIARLLGARLDYETCLRIATLAVIPTIFLSALAQTAGHPAGWPAWLGIACALGYLVFGILANRSAQPLPL
jgi:hypothetical protein